MASTLPNSIGGAAAVKAELRGERIAHLQPRWLTASVAESVHGERGRAKAIALAVGVTETRVYEVADVNGPRPLKAAWIPAIVRETGSFAILDALEAQVGRCAFVLPAPTVQRGDVMQQSAAAVREFGEALTHVANAMADGTVSRAELATIEQQLAEVHAAVASWRAVLVRDANGAAA